MSEFNIEDLNGLFKQVYGKGIKSMLRYSWNYDPVIDEMEQCSLSELKEILGCSDQ